MVWTMNERVAIVGLGYVGLPVAVAFAKHFPDVIGFDIDPSRIKELKDGHDRTHEIESSVLSATRLRFTAASEEVGEPTFIIVTVPTPIDSNKQPDLTPLLRASESVGRWLKKGAIVVYESTVYPGVTEEFCAPILERVSGLKCGTDFTLGYSPERINPGDKHHTLERTVKVVSGQDGPSLERVASAYGRVIEAGVFKATSIRVAEAAKVIENTQRDLNIALMNELALIFDRMGLRTADVIAASKTKWNFLPFTPGLVGGHCIGVDPYYLTAKAESLGYHPEVILAGRRINDSMGAFIAQQTIKLLIKANIQVQGSKVLVAGLTFKEGVPDIRNSRVPDIIKELKAFGVTPLVHDPKADPKEVHEEYGIDLVSLDKIGPIDALVLAVSHEEYLKAPESLLKLLKSPGCVVDVKSVLTPTSLPKETHYWCL